MPLYLYIYIYIIHVYKGWRGGKGRNQPFVKQPHRYATTLPPQKRGKNKIDAENGVFGIRVHHNCRKQFGMVEFFRTRLVPTLF